jgi:hypothetical protein
VLARVAHRKEAKQGRNNKYPKVEAEELRNLPVYQREPSWFGQAVNAKIHIEHRPVEMILMKEFNLQYLFDSCFAKPGKIIVGQEVFLTFDKDPPMIPGDLHLRDKPNLDLAFRTR